jgi:hypothetical protein
LKTIVSKNHTTTTANVAAELSVHLEDPLSTKSFDDVFTNPTSTVELQLLNLWLLKTKAKRRKRWCDDHKTWTSDDLKYVILSDELSFTMFSISGQVYFWRMPKEAYNPAFLVPTVKYED